MEYVTLSNGVKMPKNGCGVYQIQINTIQKIKRTGRKKVKQ